MVKSGFICTEEEAIKYIEQVCNLMCKKCDVHKCVLMYVLQVFCICY
jgi:hypothetical protein